MIFSRLVVFIVLVLGMLAAAGLCQLMVGFFFPSVTVAFVDVRVFRTWAGLGVREAAIQSAFLACVLCWILPANYERAHFARIVSSMLAVVVMTWLGVSLAIRIPAEVAGYWFGLTAVQILVGAALYRILTAHLVATESKPKVFGKATVLGTSSLAVLGVVIVIAYSFPTPRPSYSFQVELQDKTVTVDAFLPNGVGAKQLPAVVIFHGVEGATPLMRLAVHYPNSKAISELGIAAYFVRYFDASPYDDLMLLKDDQLDTDEIEKVRRKDYAQWIDFACQAITEVRNRPEVDPNRVAVIGYSLGCYVGTAATSRLCQNGYPCAVVGNFGAIWPEIEFNQSFPPIQFHHGENDPVIEVDVARAAKDRLLGVGVKEVELFVYPEQGHVPSGPGSYELRVRTEKFLREKLDVVP